MAAFLIKKMSVVAIYLKINKIFFWATCGWLLAEVD